mgnify:CR=1 FL=1
MPAVVGIQLVMLVPVIGTPSVTFVQFVPEKGDGWMQDGQEAVALNNEFKSKINDCKTIAEIAKIAQESGFKVSAIALLVYQALNILSLDDQHVDLVAHGG